MKKRLMELSMAILLLAGVFFLSSKGAQLVSNDVNDDSPVIVLDAGHGGGWLRG